MDAVTPGDAMNESPLKPEFFEREDDSPDAYFYAQARMLVHIDEYAIQAAAASTPSCCRNAARSST